MLVSKVKRSWYKTFSKKQIIALLVLFTPFLYYGRFIYYEQISINQPINQNQENKITWITVFVHGIMSIKPHLSINNFLHFMTDNVENTLYSQTVKYIRQDPFFYKNQAMLGRGLTKIDPNDIRQGNSSSGIAHFFEKMTKYSGAPDSNNLYYTFGWNGLLSSTARYQEGKKLFLALEKEVKRLREKNINPKIRVIGYSHGGNVCLNLGAIHAQERQSSNITIDELVLLGVPIQSDTAHWIRDPVFKRVYNIYSLSDRIQTLDFFSFNRFFSERYFKFELSDKIIQVEIKITRNATQYAPNSAKSKKAKNLNKHSIITGRSRLLRNTSPGHVELWFFGWTPLHYRKNYPLYPLPTLSLVPFISHHLKDIKTNAQHIVFDVRPDHEYILIRKKYEKKLDKVIPFVTQNQLTHMKQHAFKFAPKKYTREKYIERTQKAIKKAKKVYAQVYEPKNRRNKLRRCKLKKHKRNPNYYPALALKHEKI